MSPVFEATGKPHSAAGMNLDVNLDVNLDAFVRHVLGIEARSRLYLRFDRRDCISFNVFLDEFADLISQLLTSPIPFLMCGDFNIRWNLHTDSKRSQFQDLINEYGIISSTPSSPTHVLGNTIDFVLSDSLVEPFISGVHVNNNETLSDHFPITFNLQLHLVEPSNAH